MRYETRLIRAAVTSCLAKWGYVLKGASLKGEAGETFRVQKSS